MNEDEGAYYRGGYWNDLDAVQRMFAQRIFGENDGPWYQDVSASRARSRSRAL